MAVGPLHVTLVANEVTEVILDLPEPRADNLSFVPAQRSRVEVLSVTGGAEIYFTTNGQDPVIGGNGCYLLPAAICSLQVDDETPGPTSVVKLISTGTPRVSVRAA